MLFIYRWWQNNEITFFYHQYRFTVKFSVNFSKPSELWKEEVLFCFIFANRQKLLNHTSLFQNYLTTVFYREELLITKDSFPSYDIDEASLIPSLDYSLNERRPSFLIGKTFLLLFLSETRKDTIKALVYLRGDSKNSENYTIGRNRMHHARLRKRTMSSLYPNK